MTISRAKKINYYYFNYPILTVNFYSLQKDIDLILLCQHGYKSKEFLESFPEFIKPLEDYSQDIISLYLELEHDYASRDLTDEIGKDLSETLNVMSILVNCDRGIMDSNRLKDYCIPSFLYHSYEPSVILKIKKLNSFIRKTIYFLLKQFISPSGYILDIHTMWPLNLLDSSGSIINIESVCRQYMSPRKSVSPRKINFICKDSNDNWISSKKMAKSLELSLNSYNYEIDYDIPFYMLPIRSNYHYFSEYNGIAIDFPRSLFGHKKNQAEHDYSFLIKNDFGIKEISKVISRGVRSIM